MAGILKKSVIQVSEPLLNKFCEDSRAVWKEKVESTKSNHRIYVANFWSTSLANCIPRILYAKGIQERIPLQIVLLRDDYNEELEKIYNSFACKGIFLRKVLCKNKIILLKALVLTIVFWIRGHSGEDLLKLKYKGIPIGEDIYEQLIRAITCVYTIDKLKIKRDLKTVVLCYSIAITIYRIFEKNPPSFYVGMDTTYIEKLVLKVAADFKAQIILMPGKDKIDIVRERGNFTVLCSNDIIKMCIESESQSLNYDYKEYIKRYFDKRFKGVGDKEAMYAFKDKLCIDKDLFLSDMNLDNGKKNVVIMAHCFTDAARCSSFLLYRDYYNWLEETLKIASTISGVNWIVKAHPTRRHYGEGDEVFMLTERYNTGNLTYMPDEFSTTVVPQIADAIVTCVGTAGVEFACFGIPVIIAGRAWYSGYGFTVEPKTVWEYKRALQNVDKMIPLDEKKRELAMKALYSELVYLNNEPLDWLGRFFSKNEIAMYSGYVDEQKANNEVLETICNCYGNHNEILDIGYYKRGRNIMNELDYGVSQIYF